MTLGAGVADGAELSLTATVLAGGGLVQPAKMVPAPSARVCWIKSLRLVMQYFGKTRTVNTNARQNKLLVRSSDFCVNCLHFAHNINKKARSRRAFSGFCDAYCMGWLQKQCVTAL
jgi:hypothetical protein